MNLNLDLVGPLRGLGIGTQDGTAEKDQDFKGKSQKQVQFNPGQTRATWRVRILADERYEQSESFRVLLSDPVMAALEFPSAATVEILDPDDGEYRGGTGTWGCVCVWGCTSTLCT